MPNNCGAGSTLLTGLLGTEVCLATKLTGLCIRADARGSNYGYHLITTSGDFEIYNQNGNNIRIRDFLEIPNCLI